MKEQGRNSSRGDLAQELCGPLSIVRLTESSEVSRQAITKHQRALEGAGLVRSGRAGRERIWELQTKRLAEVRHYLDQISTQWTRRLLASAPSSKQTSNQAKME
jgi:DNA-binding transcriptional ArsR family regulator